jgi:hypothetical protein
MGQSGKRRKWLDIWVIVGRTLWAQRGKKIKCFKFEFEKFIIIQT